MHFQVKNINQYLLLKILSVCFILLFCCCNKINNSKSANTNNITDIDGNIYRTELIGNDIWMVENLRVTHYNNGTQIPEESENDEWCKQKTGSYCNFNNDTSLVNTYGRLYNWEVINNHKNIAPIGWHIATDKEWSKLVSLYGGDSKAGSHLKESGIENWEIPNTEADNSSKFTGVPGGFRNHIDGEFYCIYGHGYWWTADEINNEKAWSYVLGYRNNYVGHCDLDKKRGLSIRCVKN